MTTSFNSDPWAKVRAVRAARRGEKVETLALPDSLLDLFAQLGAAGVALADMIEATPVGAAFLGGLDGVHGDVVERLIANGYGRCGTVRDLALTVPESLRTRFWGEARDVTLGVLSQIQGDPACVISYHDDPELKARLCDLAAGHRAADLYRQGTYGGWEEDSAACSVGCTVRDYNRLRRCQLPQGHFSALARALGIPPDLADLNEEIFENLPADEAADWPPAFLDALPVGATFGELKDVAHSARSSAKAETVERLRPPTLRVKRLDRLCEYRALAGYVPVYTARDAVLEMLGNITPTREGADLPL